MSEFDEAERVARMVVPKSANHGKVVKLAPKQLKTEKETRMVLPEEQYLHNLEKIIVKDYFPELPKLKAQADYMDAVARNDVARMRELQIRYNTQRRTDRRTSPVGPRATSPISSDRPTSPSHFDPETPGPSAPGNTSPSLPYANEEGDNERELDKKRRKKGVENLSVDKYLNKFTSEDNASFEELSALADRREKAKNAWLYEAAEKHNKELVVRHEIAAPADVQLALRYVEEERPKALDNWTYKVRSTVLFNPDGAKLTPAEQEELRKKNQIEINKTGTRFPDDINNKPSDAVMARAAMYQAANNAGKVDIMGVEGGLDQKALGVLATPSPAPGIDDSPFMTWGSIDGTPFRLDAPDVSAPLDGAPTFKIPEVPYREQIAQGMHETIAKRYRDKRRTAMENAERAHKTPRFGSARSTGQMSLLSPAARRLATNKLGIRLGSGKSVGSTLKTPSASPLVRTPGSTSSRSGSKTPSISSMIRKTTPKIKSSITDNLMPVASVPISSANPSESSSSSSSTISSEKKRPTAGDFF